MKSPLLLLALATAFSTVGTLCADDTTTPTGKWSAKKVNDEGQNYTQTIEVKGDKFVFEIIGGDGQVGVHAEGDFKVDQLGPFKAARFSHIRAGGSASTMDEVDDEYVSVFTFDGDTWTMASNFDKARTQKPSLDAYHRVQVPQKRTLVVDEIEMVDAPQTATWYVCFEAKVGEVSRRYYVENKGYDKKQVTIPVALELPDVPADQKCTFTLKLDDVDADVVGDNVDNQSAGGFTVSERGSQSYKPEEHWNYTLRWHFK